ncbi:hypothetical protein ABPG75_007314 [Micractinium tetrahymenae]
MQSAQDGTPLHGSQSVSGSPSLQLQRALSAPAHQGLPRLGAAAEPLPPLADEQQLRVRLSAQEQEMQRLRAEQDEWAAKARAVLAQRSGPPPTEHAGAAASPSAGPAARQVQRAGSAKLLALNGLIVRLQAEIADLAAEDRQYQVKLAAEAARQHAQHAQAAAAPADAAAQPGQQHRTRQLQLRTGGGGGEAAAAAAGQPWEERRAEELRAWEARQQRARKRQGRLQQEEGERAQRAWRPEELLLQQAALVLQNSFGAGPVCRSAPARLQAAPQPQEASLIPAEALLAAPSLSVFPEPQSSDVSLDPPAVPPSGQPPSL